MNKALLLNALIAGAAFATLASSVQAQTTVVEQTGPNTTTTTTVEKSKGGAGSGAVGGAIAGALVGGPVGLVVGGVAGATLGNAVAPPSEVRTYVTTQNADTVAYPGKVVIGRTIDGDVVYRDVPAYPKYRWAYLNGERVVIDNDTHHVVAIYTN